MKKVLILFGSEPWNNEELFHDRPIYKRCYEELYERAEKRDVQFFRASYEWYDANTQTFKAWTFVDDQWQRVTELVPDVIYEKVETHEIELTLPLLRQIATHFSFVDPIEFSYLIDNKLYASLLFTEYIKPYTLVQTQDDFAQVLNAIDGEMAVAKTVTGSGGKGVYIGTKDELLQKNIEFPLIVQEFVDTSAGITGIVDGYHDFRVMIIDGEIVYAYVRTPAEGSLLANVAQGGKKIIIDNKDIPESIYPIVEAVQKRFNVYGPTVYSIDFFFDNKQQPWIVEFNAKPGMFFAPEQSAIMEPVHNAFIDFFKKI